MSWLFILIQATFNCWLLRSSERIIMITAIVKWRVNDGQSREEVLNKFKKSVSLYTGMDHLIRKYFVFSRDKDELWGMGIYLWDDESAANAFYEMAGPIIKKETGSEPEVTFFDTPMILENQTKEVQAFD
jgi:hypothetical protein